MISAIAVFDANYLGGRLRKSKRFLSKYKNRLKKNFLLKIIGLSNMVLWDLYQFPWQALQNIAHRIARCVGDMSLLLIHFPRLSAYKLTGANWSIIFVGSESRLIQLSNLFFEDEFNQEKIGEIVLWKLSAQTRKWLAEGLDLVVCELSRLHPNRPKSAISFSSPYLINQVIPIPDQLVTAVSGKRLKDVRTRLNRAERNGFSYRFSRALADFDNFFYNMYLPFIKSRHGDLATITPYEIQRRWFAKGGVLLVIRHDKPVAGALCRIANDKFFFIELGVLGTDTQIIQLGFYNIITWYALTCASGKGAKIFNMGGTRGWCSYPSFFSKRRWGARVARYTEIYPTWTFLASNMSTQLQNHLNKQGFISEINGNFYRVLLANDVDSVAEPDVNHELTLTNKEGLDGVIMVSANSKPVIHNNK